MAEDGESDGPAWLPAAAVSHKPSGAPESDMGSVAPVLEETKPAFATKSGGLRRLRMRFAVAFERPVDGFHKNLETERDRGAGFLWAPVLLAVGCIVYFLAPREPLIAAFPLLACAVFALALKIGRNHTAWYFLIAVALVAAGASLAQWRTLRINTTMLSSTTIAHVTGRVERAEIRANGSVRYTMDLDYPGAKLEARGVSNRPARIRVTARKGAPVFSVSQIVEGRIRVGPPSGPAYPGAHDFAFPTWFAGIGATGFFLGPPRLAGEQTIMHGGIGDWITAARAEIAAVINRSLPGRSGALATALIVGDRSGIDEQTADALRRSGLAHILAISGLHMALVAATVIYFIRWLFAFFPAVSLHYPVRKWAAGSALLASTAYLLLSGANVSTQRAFIMVAIMLVAIMMDRRALTMRNVAIAALIVLAITPEALFAPGFQMSFAAVAALVAVFEGITRRARRNKRRHRAGFVGLIQRFIVRDMAGLALTSLIAGLATGLFAAYHFQRVAPFGLLANLMAMPIVSLMVMPLALLSVLLMPFGLESAPLQLMAFAINGVVGVAQWVAQLEPQGNTGRIPALTMIAGAAGLLIATLARSKLRFFALPFVVMAGIGLATKSSPDILILENGRQIGVLTAGGKLRLMRPNAEKFSTEIWHRAFAPHLLSELSNKPKRAAIGEGFRCDKLGCVTRVKGVVVAYVKSGMALLEDCAMAHIIVAPFPVAKACAQIPADNRPTIIDKTSLEATGSIAIHIKSNREERSATSCKQAGTSSRCAETQRQRPDFVITPSHSPHSRPWTRHRILAGH